MRSHIGKRVTLSVVGLTVLLALQPPVTQAEEFKLPSAQELATLPPEGLQFYAQGIQALDHVDYERAYDNLAKASMLQPRAVRLNLIVAALALKQGRTKKADQARDDYETAIRCYENILATPGLDPAFRRDVENRLKIAKDERENLAQRDAQREGKGTMFIRQLNRELAKATKTPKPLIGGPQRPPIPAQAAGQGLPGAAGAPALPALPSYPGAPTPAPAGGVPGAAASGPAAAPGAPAAAGALPGLPALPGAAPGVPSAPGAPGMPAAPGAPGATPVPGAPPTGPGGEIMI